MQNGSDTALRLMIVDDSVEDAESIVSAMRNAGIAVRPLRPASADELQSMLGAQPIDLVLHEGDERRDYQGDAVKREGRKLIAEGLPAARGHDDHDILSAKHRRHHLLLTIKKVAEAEVFLQGFPGVMDGG